MANERVICGRRSLPARQLCPEDREVIGAWFGGVPCLFLRGLGPPPTRFYLLFPAPLDKYDTSARCHRSPLAISCGRCALLRASVHIPFFRRPCQSHSAGFCSYTSA